MCPLCLKPPESIYHIILHCDFVNTLWTQIHPILTQLHSKSIDDEEKALGIIHIKSTTGVILRNWITYKMREQIMLFERKAYHSPTSATVTIFKAKFENSMAYDIKQLIYRYHNENKLSLFDKIVAFRGILCEKVQEGEYRLNKVFS